MKHYSLALLFAYSQAVLMYGADNGGDQIASGSGADSPIVKDEARKGVEVPAGAAGRSEPKMPEPAKGDDPNTPRGDIQNAPPGDHIKAPFSATEADGKGDGTAQDGSGAPGDNGDKRIGESPAERLQGAKDREPVKTNFVP